MFSDLKVIAENQAIPVDLESYVKKLNNSRRRVMLVNNILQNVQVCIQPQALDVWIDFFILSLSFFSFPPVL